MTGASKAAAVWIACSVLFVRFLTTPVPSFLSLMEWAIIGVVVAVIVGGICRRLIHSGTILGALAVAAVIAGAIWTEVHFSVPLSHDTAESSAWSSRTASGLYGTWAYETAGVMAIITGWLLANRLYSKHH